MIYKDLLLQGFEEVKKIDGKEGVLLQRVPRDIRKTFEENTNTMLKKPAGNEIRFVPLEKTIKISLASYLDEYDEQGTVACVYYGDFQDRVYSIGEEPVEIEINLPEMITKYYESGLPFIYNPKVVRIMLRHGNVHLVDIKGKTRVPRKGEIPKNTMLSYGTSITHGSTATLPSLSYAKLTAWRLKMDSINLGVAGTAVCENEMADYIADRNDWDILTLCLSVNMLNLAYTAEEFYSRAYYMVNTISEKHPDKKIFCISIIKSYHDVGIIKEEVKSVSTPNKYRNALQDIVEKINSKNVIYIDGMNLLDNYNGMTTGILHPGDYGMIDISNSLYKKIKEYL